MQDQINLILLLKFESSFLSLFCSVIKHFGISSCSQRYSKYVFIKSVRRILKNSSKNSKHNSSLRYCEQSTTNGTLDYPQDVNLLLNTKDAAERREKSLISSTSDYRSDVHFEEFTISSTLDYRQNVNSLHRATAAQESRCLPTYVVLV